MLTRSKLTPLVVCTDSEAVLAARDFTHIPLVLVLATGEAPCRAARRSSPRPRTHVATAPHYASDEQAIREAWPAQADHLDLPSRSRGFAKRSTKRRRRRGRRREGSAECGVRMRDASRNAHEADVDLSISRRAARRWTWHPRCSTAGRSTSARSRSICNAEPPAAITLEVPQPPPRVFSFTFPEAPRPPLLRLSLSPSLRLPLSRSPHSRNDRKPLTRIKPPGDIIKLEDRLYYVLQPPLETLLQSDALHFPFEPFPYQYQGVAFLYPRYSAILADEMGLGKTMQAITAIRMLLRSGELRSVLLVCPKPLVTNWRREFSLWAPEIPLTIIEGDAGQAPLAMDAGRTRRSRSPTTSC